jgi:alkanesulfonate monooxygenase SsuD/methylene tetrahydromethanopterin reductase-like flavin-dependent oxidoreductase (luciferase family)
MRCGVFLLAGRFPGQDDGTALARSVDAVVAAEAAGFDDAWIAEHHFMPYGVCPSAVTFAAYAAGRTSRITVGTAVSVLSTVHPVALAEQVALVDRLAGGRFHLGVGRGGPWVDLEVFGTGADRYEHGFAESLDLLLRWLTRERVGAAGERFRFREVPVVPRPRTRPHPPVAVACTSAATVELAAARGLPMLLGLHIDADEKADLVAHYAKAAHAAGRDAAGVAHVAAVVAQVADGHTEAREAIRGPMARWLAEGLAAHVPLEGHAPPGRDPGAYVDRLLAIHPVGSPRQCIDRLRAHADRTGIDRVIMLVEGTGDHAATLANITRLGHEVLPHV